MVVDLPMRVRLCRALLGSRQPSLHRSPRKGSDQIPALRSVDTRWTWQLRQCDLKIVDAASGENARIEAPWCEGEIWTITGKDEVSVADQ